MLEQSLEPTVCLAHSWAVTEGATMPNVLWLRELIVSTEGLTHTHKEKEIMEINV